MDVVPFVEDFHTHGPRSHIRRLDEVSAVSLGYPHELLAAAEQRATMTGNRWDQIDFPERSVA